MNFFERLVRPCMIVRRHQLLHNWWPVLFSGGLFDRLPVRIFDLGPSPSSFMEIILSDQGLWLGVQLYDVESGQDVFVRLIGTWHKICTRLVIFGFPWTSYLFPGMHTLSWLQCCHRNSFDNGACVHLVIVHTKLPPSPVTLWIELGGSPKWLPLNFGYHDAMWITTISCFVLFFTSLKCQSTILSVYL